MTFWNQDIRAELEMQYQGVRVQTRVSQVVEVRLNPTADQFSSVAAAVASITDASATKVYQVDIGPGIYTEAPFTVPPFIVLKGHDAALTTLVTSDDNSDFITLSQSCSVTNLTISGPTTSGACLSIAPTATGDPIDIQGLIFAAGNTFITCINPSYEVTVWMIRLATPGPVNFLTGLEFQSSTVPVMCFMSGCSFVSSSTNSSAVGLSLSGSALSMKADAAVWVFNGYGTVISISDGADLDASALDLDGADVGLHVQNVGAAPSTRIVGSDFESVTWDILVEHPGAEGFAFLPTEYSKISINTSAPFFIPNKDLNIITVAVRGGDFTSIAAAVSSITSTSATNRYVVSVGPGTFVEPTITLQPYIYIRGSGADSTIIQTNNPNQNAIIGSAFAEVSDLTVSGSTGTGYAAFYFSNTNSSGNQFTIRSINFGDSNIFIRIVEGTQTSLCDVHDIGYNTATFDTKFVVETPTGVQQAILDVDTVRNSLFTSFSAVANISGTTALFFLTNASYQTFVGGELITVSNGGSLGLNAVNAIGFDTALEAQNVGAAPNIFATSCFFSSTTNDLLISHPGTTGSFQGVADQGKVTINPSAPLRVDYTDPFDDDGMTGVVILGDVRQGSRHDQLLNISTLISQTGAMGAYTGGDIDFGISSFTVSVSAGAGYFYDANNNYVREADWNFTSLTIPASSDVYVVVSGGPGNTGIVTYQNSEPDFVNTILLGRVVTNGIGVDFIERSIVNSYHVANRIEEFHRNALGPVYASGSIVTVNGTNQLNVSAGVYYFGINEFQPSGGTAIDFDVFYRDGMGGYVELEGINVVDTSNFDAGLGSLSPLTSGYFAKHALYVVGDDSTEAYFFVYSQTQYSALTLAEQGNIPTPPPVIKDGVTLIASIIVQQGAPAIVEIRDERPVIGFKASGVAATTYHGNLLGLGNDDHKQYLLVNGTRAMAGPLDMGGNAVTNAGQYNGVTVEAHEARHLPNGADALPTAAPMSDLNAVTANATGVQNTLARSDHSHAIDTAPAVTITPDQANATGVSTYLARADHMHTIASLAAVTITPDQQNATGVSTAFSRSDHVHLIPSSAPTGLIPDQANATGVAASFARSDHTHNIASTAPANQTIAAAAATGVSNAFARADHGHTFSTAAPATGMVPDQPNATGVATTFSRSDHVHLIPSSAPTGLIPDQANATGVAASFARSDHTHFIQSNAPVTLTPDVANATGTSNAFSRSDHKHNIASSAPTGLNPDAGNATGVSNAFARADHVHNIASTAPANQTIAAAAATGVSNAFARADHGHTFSTAAPATGMVPDQPNATGVATTFSRSDHVHLIPSSAPTGLIPDKANATGIAASFARSDHTHFIQSNAPTGLNPDAGNATGVSNAFARADHVHNIASSAPTGLNPDAGNATGVSNAFARADHVHNVASSAPANQTIAAAAATGVSNAFARADHGHTFSTAAPATGMVPDQPNATGVATTFSRSDHVHLIPSSAPTGLIPDQANATGVAASFARSDHTHFIQSNAPTGLNPDAGNATGVSNAFARADHIHNVASSAAVSISTSTVNATGVATSFARSDHTHAVSVTNSSQFATGVSITSGTDAVVLTSTPASGTYLVVASVQAAPAAGNSNTVVISIYSGGTQVAGSTRTVTLNTGFGAPTITFEVSTFAIATVNGSQAIALEAHETGGTATLAFATMILAKLS